MLAISCSLLFLPHSSGKSVHLNAGTDIGELLSYDISSNEYDITIDNKRPKVFLGDHAVSEIWEDVQLKPVSVFGSEAKIGSLHGASNIYFILYQEVTDDGWIAMQFDTAKDTTKGDMKPMDDGDDIWVFGTAAVLGDCYAQGEAVPIHDKIDNLSWERVLVNDTGGATIAVAWEVVRSLKTGDNPGFDVEFNETSVNVMLASNNGHHTKGNEVMEVTLSDITVGSGTTVTTEEKIAPVIDGNRYVMKHISIGLVYGGITYLIVVFPTMYIVKRENKKEGVSK
jgi:hypothetical protein